MRELFISSPNSQQESKYMDVPKVVYNSLAELLVYICSSTLDRTRLAFPPFQVVMLT